jgi:hypothetical protein
MILCNDNDNYHAHKTYILIVYRAYMYVEGCFVDHKHSCSGHPDLGDELADFSKTLITTNQPTRCHNQEDHNINLSSYLYTEEMSLVLYTRTKYKIRYVYFE